MTSTNPFDDVFKTLKPLLNEADRISKFAKDILGDLPTVPRASFDEPVETDEEDDGSVNFKAVFNLGLADSLILDDGAWQVVAIEEDGFDTDLVSVALENGETYSLLRTSLVWVV